MKESKIFFQPRVGTKYNEGFKGLKILILGESHYCGEACEPCAITTLPCCTKFTLNVMDRYIDYKNGLDSHESWMRTFTRFTNVLFGEQVHSKRLIEFWDSVIFYNYVQSSTNKSRIPPTYQQFKHSEDAFFEVLETYEPDAILIWGKRLWGNLPENGEWATESVSDSELALPFYYSVNNKKIPAFCLYHPSSSYFNYGSTVYIDEIFRSVASTKASNRYE